MAESIQLFENNEPIEDDASVESDDLFVRPSQVSPSSLRRVVESIHSSTPDFGPSSESDGEDGLFCENEALTSDHEDDGFYNDDDDDQVVIASDAYSWKIDHSKGDHKLKGEYYYVR